MGCHFLLQGIFLTQGLNPRLLLDRWILYHWATWESPHLTVVCVKNSVLRAGVLFFISLGSATYIKKAEFTREMRLLIPILYFVKIKKEGNAYTYYNLWPMLHASAVHWSLVFLSSSIQWHQSGSRKFALVRVFIHCWRQPMLQSEFFGVFFFSSGSCLSKFPSFLLVLIILSLKSVQLGQVWIELIENNRVWRRKISPNFWVLGKVPRRRLFSLPMDGPPFNIYQSPTNGCAWTLKTLLEL